jgi:hypothetical protein
MSQHDTFSTDAIRECIEACAIDNPELAARAATELARAGARAEGKLEPYQVIELGYGSRTVLSFHALSDKDAWEKTSGVRGRGKLLVKEVEGR